MQTGLAFHQQIRRVVAKATAKIGTLTSALTKLSLESAMKVFEVQIRPIVTYGLYLFSPRLEVTTLALLDTVKSRFLKRALQLPVTSSTERVHAVAGCRRFCEDLKEKNYSFDKKVFEEYLQGLVLKRRDTTPFNAISDDTWRLPLRPRHFLVGYAVHGFHHRLCNNGRYHERNPNCICRFCLLSTEALDHLMECRALVGRSDFERYTYVLKN